MQITFTQIYTVIYQSYAAPLICNIECIPEDFS